ncbi:phosphatidylinositol-specific phospholipase C domain-containing protein [Streptosporangium sp. NPDC051023]|uniref:phosphatidylinositol-specific phospholipase C domain-containing protein n=1 Tax=Streptosporangium sp. NPDC051023 TaxID=3155410 RepID=UPI003450C227
MTVDDHPYHTVERALVYTNTAYAVVKNNTGITLKSLTLHHQYSSDGPSSTTWSLVGPGATTTPMTVYYNTGFIRTGQDYWWVEYTLPDGSEWVSPQHLKATLKKENDGKRVTWIITGSMLTGSFTEDGMQLTMSAEPKYNAWAAVAFRNDLPVAVSATLEHQYSSDQVYDHRWSPVPPDSTTGADQAFIVYFNTGMIRTGLDYWNLSIQLDIPPYDNAPAEAFAPFTNASRNTRCTLQGSDNGKTHTVIVDGRGMILNIASGWVMDQWRTWNGYNTLALIQIRNDFASTISTVVLTHRYSDDTTWRQTRALIPAGGHSPWMVVEYNIGYIRTGLDYWNVWVYLENGEWYQNHRADKECMLGTEDAVTPSTFSVSTDKFRLDLASGSCQDSMDDKGRFAPAGGRDANKPYNENAFIGSHNAYANFANGFWYAQQTGSIETQLALGATTLLLDIWYYDGDIYLKHEDIGLLQPFVSNQPLSAALAAIRGYLTMQSRDPVTIIFEDHVDEEYQNLIKQAFLTSDTWGMVFNPNTYDVDQNGWPTLAGFFEMQQPLIVMTSNQQSPDFAYQWAYMSENVYGDASLDPATWLNPRCESQPLNQFALCALNHFTTWTVSGFTLSAWIDRSSTDNATTLLTTMTDACHNRWKRYPNYINADFWEVPPDGLIDTMFYLNQKLQNITLPIIRVENGRAILEETDHSRLLRGDWDRATRWIDRHLDRICVRPDPDQHGPIAHQLVDMVNLSLIVSTLHAALPSGETVVQDWLQRTVRELARYLLDIEPAVLRALDGGAAAFDELCCIPYLLFERSGTTFEVTDVVRARARDMSVSGDHDRILLAGLAGNSDAAPQLTHRLVGTRADLVEDRRTSRIYDLTHEILYRFHLEPRLIPEPSITGELESLLDEVLPVNADLGAELLACHWLTGGPVSPAARTAVERLKAVNEALQARCETDHKDGRHCPLFKDQIHNRLTMVLGLGMTLAVAGEVLDTSSDRTTEAARHIPASNDLAR